MEPEVLINPQVLHDVSEPMQAVWEIIGTRVRVKLTVWRSFCANDLWAWEFLRLETRETTAMRWRVAVARTKQHVEPTKQ